MIFFGREDIALLLQTKVLELKSRSGKNVVYLSNVVYLHSPHWDLDE